MTVSLGPQKVAIPSVDGMNETIATITIRRTGLQVGAVVGLPYAYAPENTVIAQTPTGNATDVEGPRVSILTAHPAPPPDNASVMPDMIGDNFTQAALAIIHTGFKLAPLQNPPALPPASAPTGQPPAAAATSLPATAPAGSVIAQVPAAGTRIPAGSAIQLTVQP
jgi:beta-lactam-binding protein with PASTA domain